MKKPYSYLWAYVIVLASFLLLSVGGSSVTLEGMEWYQTLQKPSWTPPGWSFGVAWTTIYICFGLSALLFLRREQDEKTRQKVIAFYVINAVANFSWSFLFFRYRLIELGFWHTLVILATLLILMAALINRHRVAFALLLPYLLWLCVAIPLSYSVWRLNA